MTAMDTENLETLRRAVAGSILRPEDEGFDEATFLWNAMIDRSPALVVQPRDTADVAAAVDFARTSGVPLAVRSGGHNIAGTALADDGVTLDMSLLRRVEVDAARKLAVVQPGCQLGDVFRAIAPIAGSGPGFGTRTPTCVGQVAAWLAHGNQDTVVQFTAGTRSRPFAR